MSAIRRFNHLIILILLPLILILIWFRSGFIKGGGEEGLIFYNPTKTLELSKLMWWDYNGGFPTLAWLVKISSLFPTHFLYGYLNLPGYLLQAGTYLIILVTGGFSVYLLTLSLLGKYRLKETVALVSAIFYLFNPFSISQIWSRGLYSQHFSFALLPLATLLFLLGLIKRKFIYLFYFIIASVILSSAFGITTFVITFWTVLTMCVIYWIFVNEKSFKNILFGLTFYLFALVLWFITNLWWFLPTIISGNKIYFGYLENREENLGTLLGVSRNFTPEVIIRLLQRTYFFDPSAFSPIYSSLAFQLISFLIPIFLVIGLIVIFKMKELGKFKFFVLLFALGLLVSLGANPPLGWLFVWIFNHSPFLQSFRNPYEKFGLVYALGYTPLFALGVVYFFEQRFNQKQVKFLGLLMILILVCGIYAWPMWTGQVVAGPDKKFGVDVPKYYQDLNQWLTDHKREEYSVFMTPLWAGDGAFYKWNETKYIGLDPMIYILDTPAVSSSPRFPYFYDFMQSIRKYMGNRDVSGSLSLLRAKYLIAREDAFNISYAENMHEKYLTEAIYPPLGVNNIDRVICQNEISERKENNPAWITCELNGSKVVLSDTRYLYVVVKTDIPANLDLAIRDTHQRRVRWYGRTEEEYFLEADKWNEILIPLGTPSEPNNEIDFSKIELIEIQAHPLGSPNASVGKIELKGMWLDPGKEEKINKFRQVESFGKLRVYEPNLFNSPPEFGLLASLEEVKNFEELFERVAFKQRLVDKYGFTLLSQNVGKDLKLMGGISGTKITNLKKISDTKYWVKLEEDQPAYIVLSKNFNPEWKIIIEAEEEDLTDGFWGNLKLLKKELVSEQRHFVVNGYANLWIVNGNNSQYAVVFMPQIIADVGSKISITSIILLIFTASVWSVRSVWKKVIWEKS